MTLDTFLTPKNIFYTEKNQNFSLKKSHFFTYFYIKIGRFLPEIFELQTLLHR